MALRKIDKIANNVLHKVLFVYDLFTDVGESGSESVLNGTFIIG